MTLEIIISFFFTSLALTISPGPDIMYVLSTSLAKGKQFGIAAVIGLSSGLLFHTTLLAFGISTLIVAIPWLFIAIKVFGTLYLLRIIYLLYKAPIEPITVSVDHAPISRSNVFQQIQQGLIMNILNPKIMLFFLSLFPSFLHPELGNIKMQVYTLGSIFMLQALIVFCLIAVLSGYVSKFLMKNKYVQGYMNYFQIAIFIALIVFMWIK
ncbi:LysE family translocator [Paenimyroides baculatum]|uniref:LysE family translocator n=1 Tax=Paenimyroides baculatum TaxID=2608000 RepID=A0A5M6CT79_9FLAO|nr:LysE family translocator [Paenimyroides baculatum]KAA5538441.1 LysE family translocator [Paenimyroides baculatum]